MKFVALLFYNLYSLFFCLRYFPLKQALRRPVLLTPFVKVVSMHKGAIVLKSERARLVFGFRGMHGQSNAKSILCISKGGCLELEGFATMSKGTRLIIDDCHLKIGRNFYCNGDCFIRCTKDVSIGEDNMWGWNVSLNTSDGHHTFQNGQKRPMEGTISISEKVWIASNTSIHKNTYIAPGCVIAQMSLVTGAFVQKDSLIGGIPAKIIKDQYTWTA